MRQNDSDAAAGRAAPALVSERGRRRPVADRTAAVRRLLEDPDTFGTVLLLAAVDAFGVDCLGDASDPDRGPWHPATFRDEFARLYGATLPPGNVDRLMAAVLLVTTDVFFCDLAAFAAVSLALARNDVDADRFDLPDVDDCLWAVVEAGLLSPPDEDDPAPRFAPEVRRFVRELLAEEGFVTVPRFLQSVVAPEELAAAARHAHEHADDPALFAAVYDLQKGKAADAEALVCAQVGELTEQLARLPLENGTVAGLLPAGEGRS